MKIIDTIHANTWVDLKITNTYSIQFICLCQYLYRTGLTVKNIMDEIIPNSCLVERIETLLQYVFLQYLGI